MSTTALAVAFGGGVISLLSPCVLPVVPAYLSITTGLGLTEARIRSDSSFPPGPGAAIELLEPAKSLGTADATTRPDPRRPVGSAAVLRGGGLFVAGFSIVFVVLGLSATAIGSLLLTNHVPVTRVSGFAVIAMAMTLFVTTLSLRWAPWRDLRFHPQVSRYGIWAAPIAGAAFAFGWTPCIGPILGSVLAVAADQSHLAQGAALLGMYAAGLAVPFLVIALAFHRSLIALRFVRRYSVLLTRSSATVLAVYGVFLALNQLSWFTVEMQRWASALGLARLVHLG
jgi:cytochrome c-type biogenesis protein